ncbi:MAG TPA: proline iminopeptidase-family hydrolase [Gemmatimonadaceae bacterium]
MRAIVAAAFSLVALACDNNPRDVSKELNAGSGYVNVPGGRVWYNVTGTGHRTPLLVIHGGPGGSSYYLKPLAALGDDRKVIFYDQLGGGHSDKPNDTTLWRVDRFVEEVDSVRKALGLERVHILGHSFGTMILANYLDKNPRGVRSAIFSSPVLDMAGYMEDVAGLLKKLPDSIQKTISVAEESGKTDSPAYQSAMMTFYHEYLARQLPWSADIDSTLSSLNPGPYVYMQGPSEFTINGTLKSYDATASLRDIRSPVLYIVGQYDEVVPARVRKYRDLTPGSDMEVIANAAHLSMQDQPEAYVKTVRDWLRYVERE